MNLRHLAVFHAVAQCGSISAAASKLFVSQPAVSRELAELERRLGLTLFDRLPRGVRLTEAGVLLFDYARRIFALEQAAQSALEELADLRGGRLAIGASSTLGMYVLPSRVAEFHREHPGLKLSLEVGNTSSIEQHLLEHRIALGFVEGPVKAGGFETHLFMQDEIVAVVAAGHPLASRSDIRPEELAGVQMVLREPGSGTRAIVEQVLQSHGITPAETLEMGSTEAIKRAVIAGSAMTWLSQLCVGDELALGTLATLNVRGLRIKRPMFALWLKDTHLPPAASAFLDMLEIGRATAKRGAIAR